MSERTAVAIVGGGAMGSSVAYHLKSDPTFTGRVVVIERDPTYARASSALSASSIRQQFSTPLNIHLSRYGIGFLRRARELLDVDLGLKEPGYLFLASAAGEAAASRSKADSACCRPSGRSNGGNIPCAYRPATKTGTSCRTLD